MPKIKPHINTDENNVETLVNWADAFAAGAGRVGGKAWNLGRLHRYGFDIPKGGVIPISVYKQFILHNQLNMEMESMQGEVSLQNLTLDATKQRILQLNEKIKNSSFPSDFSAALEAKLAAFDLLDKAVAVRSSANSEDSPNASFAGIHDSFLNIYAMENILTAIKDCFASVWTARAIAYRRKMAIDDCQVLPAVIIMQMVDADAAGVAFSCDPVSGREDVCLISANFGLGESVVNGSVDADAYYVERSTYRIVEERIGAKQSLTVTDINGGTQEKEQDNAQQRVLNEGQQKHLSIIVARVFSVLGDLEQHQDIEWAIMDGQFYVLQARPVTVLPRYTENGIQNQSDIWSNANFRDAVPMVIPYLQRDSLLRNLNRTILTPFKDIGYCAKPGLMIARYHRGRAYFNTSLYEWLMYNAIGMKPEDLHLFLGGHQPHIQIPKKSPYLDKHGPRRLFAMLKYVGLISHYQKQQEQLYAKVDRFIHQFCNTDLITLTNSEFLNYVESTENEFLDFTDKYMALCGGVGPFGIAIKQLQTYFGDEAIGIVNALASGRGDLPSADQGYQLLELAELAREEKEVRDYLSSSNIDAHSWKDLPEHSVFKQRFRAYLKQYGYRSTYEMDCSCPRWSEDPSYLLINIGKTIDSANAAEHKRRQQQAYREGEQRLKEKVGFLKRQWVMNLIKQGVKGAETREKAKSYTVKLTEITRRVSLECGRRLQGDGVISEVDDIFYSTQAEVYAILSGYWDGRQLPLLIEERRQIMKTMSKENAPDVLINDNQIFEQAIATEGTNRYKGIGVSAGIVEGKARIVHTPDEGENLKPGDIMVAPSTNPAWTPLFIHAGGIVLETGGYTSHGFIVAREYGIPAVVNIPGVMQLIKNGQNVLVNANNGTVTLK